ncbi:MAG: tetratricopeptide repeat protein [Cyanobacteriota bacterium]
MNDKLKQIGIEGSIFGDNAQVSIEQNLILPPVQEQAKQNLHNLPKSGAAKFVGRDEVLTGLATQLRETDRVAIAALTGMGGLGKSELALRYAWREWENKTYLGGVVWLTVAESDPGLSLLTFAQVHLGLRLLTEGELAERVRFCWQNWFRNEQDQALIIFDDVRKVEQIRDFLPPPDRRFKVIITTRNEQIARNFNPINLEVLSSDAAVELLAVFLPDAVASHPEKAQELANCLGYLPLGIELAGRYGQYMGLGLGELLERLQAQKLRDASLQVPENALMTAQRGVAAAFELSWGELSAGSRLAGEWLSLFAESGIPEHLALALFEERSSSLEKQPGGITEILQRYLPTFSRWFGLGRSPQPPLERGAIQGSSLESEAMESGSVEMEGIDLLKPSREDLRHLVNLNLLIDVGNNCYELHTLIRYYLREKLEASALKDEAKRTYGRVMVGIAQTVEQTLSLEDIAKLEPYIEHLKVAAEELYQWLDDEDLFWPFTGLGRFYSAQGLYPQAAPYFESCLTLSEQRFGKNHPEVAASLNNLAELYHDQGKYGEAELLHRRSLAIMEKQLGADHPHVANSLNNLALLYDNQGKYAEAEPLYRRSLAIKEKQLGFDHPDVVIGLNNLASLCRDQGKYEEAEPLYQRAIAICSEKLGENHPNTQTVIMNLFLMLSQFPDEELNRRFSPEMVKYIQSLRQI